MGVLEDAKREGAVRKLRLTVRCLEFQAASQKEEAFRFFKATLTAEPAFVQTFAPAIAAGSAYPGSFVSTEPGTSTMI